MRALLDADWSEADGPLSLERSLSLDVAMGARLFRNARAILDALVESGGTRATSAGNLNREFVREMMDALEWSDARNRAYLEERRKVVNEDFWQLRALRVLLDLAAASFAAGGTKVGVLMLPATYIC